MDVSSNNRVIITPTAQFDCRFDLKNYPYQNTRDGIPGYFSDSEGEFYNEFALRVRGGTVLEIGTMHGLSLSYIIKTCQNNKNQIYSIDKCYQEDFVNNIKKWQAEETITYIVGNSASVSHYIEDNSVDLLFIDGWHDYLTVRNDILFYLLKMKHNSIMLGHDMDHHWPDVKVAVDSIFINYNQLDRMWWVQNPKEKIIKFL